MDDTLNHHTDVVKVHWNCIFQIVNSYEIRQHRYKFIKQKANFAFSSYFFRIYIS